MNTIPFHWTVHAQNLASIVYPLGMLFYHNLHDAFVYRRYFVKQSPVKIDENEELVHRVEEELAGLSDRRARPISNVKMSIVLVDSLEPETVGAFAFNAGPLLKINTRILMGDNVDKFRKTFRNLNSFIGKQEPFVDVEKVSDGELKKVLLSDKAVKFILTRELNKADSVGEIFVPAIVGCIIFNIPCALLKPMSRMVGSLIALSVSLVMCSALSYLFVQSFKKSRIYHYDRMAYSCDDPVYVKGCEDYLKASKELGKLLREKNGADSKIGRQFAENGDYLPYGTTYSMRLKALRDYVNELEEIQKKIAKKIKAGKIRHPQAA